MSFRPLLLVTALLLAGCTAGEPAATPLERALQTFEGRFEWSIARQDYSFSDRPGLGVLLGRERGALVPALVACIDDPRPAAATLDGRPVSLGVMCYQALRQTAYVEADNWPGHIGLFALPSERTAAKEAWQAALAEHRAVPL